MLFQPLALRSGKILKNQLVVAPMTTYASQADGTISPDELPYLQRRAEGGFGMVITAACYVQPSGHAFDGQWGCEHDGRLGSLRSACEAIHKGGSYAALQIHHGGRQCPLRHVDPPLSASAIASPHEGAPLPRAMTEKEIRETVEAFGQATRRAAGAGYDGVEIHGANTYLLQQFVSPHSNRRSDAYGQDRLLFSRQVVESVLAHSGSMDVGYRLSPEEGTDPGLRMRDTEALIDMLLGYPLSWIDVSLRRYDQPSIVGEYEEPTLARIARQIGGRVPIIGVGQIWEREDAEACMELGADMVSMARAALTEPEWPKKAASGEPIRKAIPAINGAEAVTLPAGLARKIDATPGWIPVEGR